MRYPKISIITPSFNHAKYLEQTILSVLNQNYPNLEYIIIDGGSNDNSIEIIKKYANRLAFWVSEPDDGLYDALQKGFEKSTGDIMGWLNSDDMLHNNSLFSIAEILSLDKVEWIQGVPTLYDELGRTINVLPHERWSKCRYWLNDFKWIQQESTYWTRKLWSDAGGYISTNYKYAGDMELWNRFFKYEKLFTPNCLIGGFRIRTKGQLSLEGEDKYSDEAELILKKNILGEDEKENIKKIKRINTCMKLFQKSRVLNVELIMSRLRDKRNDLYHFPNNIRFCREKQTFLL